MESDHKGRRKGGNVGQHTHMVEARDSSRLGEG